MIFADKTVLITGGTGSLGKILTRRILSERHGTPKKVIIFSRDEAKQHAMRMDYMHKKEGIADASYSNFGKKVEFQIGDVRDYSSVARAISGCDIVISAAALKQVPSCEYFVEEAVKTNIMGPLNISRAIREGVGSNVEITVGVSTDKACKPVNAMGMTKALQEKAFISANLSCPNTRFVCVRYGNVLASRGSVIPFFHEQIRNGGPLTITSKKMTRFLITLEDAVDTIVKAIEFGNRGETYIPILPSANITDLAIVLRGDRKIDIIETGIRPGEKIHEILISEEERPRTVRANGYYVIRSSLPELQGSPGGELPSFEFEYSSSDVVVGQDLVKDILTKNDLLSVQNTTGELLR